MKPTANPAHFCIRRRIAGRWIYMGTVPGVGSCWSELEVLDGIETWRTEPIARAALMKALDAMATIAPSERVERLAQLKSGDLQIVTIREAIRDAKTLSPRGRDLFIVDTRVSDDHLSGKVN